MGDREDWRVASSENASRLEHAIGDLRSSLSAGRFADFWGRVKDVSSLFRNLRPIAGEDRERLWSEFGSLCEYAKTQQVRLREQRVETSRKKREVVEHKLRDAHYQAKAATSGSDLREANRLLAEAHSWMKAGWSQVSLGDDLISLNDGRMTREDHDACWQRAKEIKETIDWKYREFKESWRAKQGEERSRRVERVNKARTAIYNLERQIDHCRDLQSGAKSWEYESKVQGWIDEKVAKVRDIEESIRRDEDVIADIDRRLRE